MGSAWAGVVPKLLESIVEGNVMPLCLTLLGGCAPAMLAFWAVRRIRVLPAPDTMRGLRILAALPHPAVWRLIGTGILLASGGLVLPFLTVYFLRSFEADSSVVALVRSIGILAMAAGALSAPVLAREAGLVSGVVVVVGCLVSAPWLFLIGFASTWWVAMISYGLRTFCVYCSDPLHTDLSMRVVPASLRATTNRLTFLSRNVSLAVTGAAGGVVITWWGLSHLVRCWHASYGPCLTLLLLAFHHYRSAIRTPTAVTWLH